jgi:hypothetical protein
MDNIQHSITTDKHFPLHMNNERIYLSMSQDEFLVGATWLCEKLKENRDKEGGLQLHNWKLTNSTLLLLEHSPVVQGVIHKNQEILADREEVCVGDENIIVEDSIEKAEALLENDEISLLEWKFTVVYSHVWRIPVLYFQVYTSEGSLLSREEVLSLILPDESTLNSDESWTFLSHEEHPVTGMPSFFLHPCQTAARLGTLMHTSDCRGNEGKIMLCWLSMVLPSVGFRISPRIGS